MVYDNFLLVYDPFRHSVHQINLADESVGRVQLASSRLTDIAYDGVDMIIYLNEQTSIKRRKLNETETENITPQYISRGDS